MASGPERDSSDLRRDLEAYLLFEAVRWPEGPATCPHCGAAGRCSVLSVPGGLARPTRTGRLSARRVWRCAACRRQFSVLTGSLFERTRVPLPLWLDALRILSDPGVCPSSTDLARAIGVSVDTARVMSDLVSRASSAAGQLQG